MLKCGRRDWLGMGVGLIENKIKLHFVAFAFID